MSTQIANTTLVSAFALVAGLSGAFDVLLSTNMQFVLFVMPSLGLALFWIYFEVMHAVDCIMSRRAIERLQYGDWAFFGFVFLQRGVRNPRVLADPAVGLLLGHLFERMGLHEESRKLIGHSIGASPALGTVSFPSNDELPEEHVKILTAGLRNAGRENFLYRALATPRNRSIVIWIVGFIVTISLLVQIVKISWSF